MLFSCMVVYVFYKFFLNIWKIDKPAQRLGCAQSLSFFIQKSGFFILYNIAIAHNISDHGWQPMSHCLEGSQVHALPSRSGKIGQSAAEVSVRFKCGTNTVQITFKAVLLRQIFYNAFPSPLPTMTNQNSLSRF